MASKKRGLGRGLEALLGAGTAADADKSADVPSADGRLAEIPVEWIRPGRYQPRNEVEPEALAELAASITAQGILQPIVLRETDTDRYEIIAGERRWRAAQLAGLATVPAVIRLVPDEAAIAMSLIENIQREDLNPLEEAVALHRLIEEFSLTHQAAADAVGKSRAAVSNLLRLMSLDAHVAEMLTRGDLEMGHARALLTLERSDQVTAAREIAARGLNVRQAEALVRRLSAPKSAGPASQSASADTRRLEEQLAGRLGQKVDLQHRAKGKGKLVIHYNSLDELDGILTHFGDLDT
jgi:ParB family chromosome partitioning protein